MWIAIIGGAVVSIVLVGTLVGLAVVAGWFVREEVSEDTDWSVGPYGPARRLVILVASKDGELTIGATIEAGLRTGLPVFVVSDGSTDRTAQAARRAGAVVLELHSNLGKPAALRRAFSHFGLRETYDAVAILDDDVIIDSDFAVRSLELLGPRTAIVVGRCLTYWPKDRRWNIFLAQRSYAYCLYQATIRPLQSAINSMNCIAGSNSLYRTEVLDRVLVEETPYIVDDTYWTLEVHRLGLGRIVYAPRAHAWIQDPTCFGDWYAQNLRWLWGTMQGIIGHRVGTRATVFDAAYLMLIAQWVIYIVSEPVVIWLLIAHTELALLWIAVRFGVGYLAVCILVALYTRNWRLVVMMPAIIVLDYFYRLLFIHAFIKAVRQPTVGSCTWESPARLRPE